MAKLRVTKICRHRKRIAMVSAFGVDCTPDQEPYTPDVIEQTPFDSLWLESITLYYCERCKRIVACDVEPADIREEPRMV